MKILIVEDEASLREIIKKSLEKEHYIVETADSFSTAAEKTGIYSYDCILLDLMLPDGSGIDLLKKMKTEGKRENVIIISAKDSIEDKVLGLELGADDYLPKPFHLAELSARVKSVIRRNVLHGDSFITAGNLTLFPNKRQVTVNQKEITLGKKEYDMLYFFLNRMNHLVGKDTIAEAVWGDNIDQVDNYDFIYAHIKNIKRKLKEAGATIEILAVYGFGYKMVETN